MINEKIVGQEPGRNKKRGWKRYEVIERKLNL